MSYVICTLLNASNEISGVAFEDHPEGKVSVEAVPADVAERFASIEGYKVVKDKGGKKPAASKVVEPQVTAPVATDANTESAEGEPAKASSKK